MKYYSYKSSSGGGGGGGSSTWSDITGKPSTFPATPETVQIFDENATINNTTNKIDFANGRHVFIKRNGASGNLTSDVFLNAVVGYNEELTIENVGVDNFEFTFQSGEIAGQSPIVILPNKILRLEVVKMNSKLIWSHAIVEAV